jgi:hypothetical protein
MEKVNKRILWMTLYLGMAMMDMLRFRMIQFPLLMLMLMRLGVLFEYLKSLIEKIKKDIADFGQPECY